MDWLEREEKNIYMGHFCEISLIAKYFAISEMLKICLCTNEVAPRGPYPLDFLKFAGDFADGEILMMQLR